MGRLFCNVCVSAWIKPSGCASLPVLCVNSYTHNIEAVSCDEALVDITEILAETRLTPDEFANAVRMEIKDQTKCAASVGIGQYQLNHTIHFTYSFALGSLTHVAFKSDF